MNKLEQLLPKLVLAPAFLLGLAFIYGFMVWNGVLSVSVSRMLPNYEFVGLAQYERLMNALTRVCPLGVEINTFGMVFWMALAFIIVGSFIAVVGGTLLCMAALLEDRKSSAQIARRSVSLGLRVTSPLAAS